MTVVVWKQELLPKMMAEDGTIRASLPRGAEIVRAGIAPNNNAAFWFVCDPNQAEDKEERIFRVVFTGEHIESGGHRYHGTWWQGGLVYHLFEMFEDPSLLMNVLKETA